MKKKILYGSIYTTGASLWWGIIGVIYFKFVSFASPLELTIHRTLWTTFLLLITTSYLSKWNEFYKICNFKNLFILLITGLLVSVNWFTLPLSDILISPNLTGGLTADNVTIDFEFRW